MILMYSTAQSIGEYLKQRRELLDLLGSSTDRRIVLAALLLDQRRYRATALQQHQGTAMSASAIPGHATVCRGWQQTQPLFSAAATAGASTADEAPPFF
jgi:hypothetical protein